MDNLIPIIPTSGDSHLLGAHLKVMHETDLISPHRPTFDEAARASAEALDRFERVIRNPERYSYIYRYPQNLEIWRNADSHKFSIFREKYTGELERFCLENLFGTESNEGVLVPTQLGHIYMSLLANEIGKTKNLPILTDISYLDRLNLETTVIEDRNLRYARSIINLNLPDNLNQIKIDEIIKLRNKKGFKATLSSFHRELNNFINNIENPTPSPENFSNFISINEELTDYIAEIGASFISVALASWIVLNSDPSTIMELINDSIAPAAQAGIASLISFRSIKNGTFSRRKARQYVSNINRMNFSRAIKS